MFLGRGQHPTTPNPKARNGSPLASHPLQLGNGVEVGVTALNLAEGGHDGFFLSRVGPVVGPVHVGHGVVVLVGRATAALFELGPGEVAVEGAHPVLSLVLDAHVGGLVADQGAKLLAHVGVPAAAVAVPAGLVHGVRGQGSALVPGRGRTSL